MCCVWCGVMGCIDTALRSVHLRFLSGSSPFVLETVLLLEKWLIVCNQNILYICQTIFKNFPKYCLVYHHCVLFLVICSKGFKVLINNLEFILRSYVLLLPGVTYPVWQSSLMSPGLKSMEKPLNANGHLLLMFITFAFLWCILVREETLRAEGPLDQLGQQWA